MPEAEPGAHANVFTVVGRQSGGVSLSVPHAVLISSVVVYKRAHMSLKLLENSFSSIHQQMCFLIRCILFVQFSQNSCAT